MNEPIAYRQEHTHLHHHSLRPLNPHFHSEIYMNYVQMIHLILPTHLSYHYFIYLICLHLSTQFLFHFKSHIFINVFNQFMLIPFLIRQFGFELGIGV